MTDSLFKHAPDIVPRGVSGKMSVTQIVQLMGSTCFEARNVYRAAELFRRMVDQGDTIWLGIAGAGIAGGMGGMVISLLEAGFVDVICSTGAQVYHDLHFAFGLPVKSIHPNWDDDSLRRHGDTRIYDIGIREKETLEAQDAIIRRFVSECHAELKKEDLSSWQFNHLLGRWVGDNAPHPERSFTVAAARLGVPIFWDSLSNHSIAMNLVRTEREGLPVRLSAQKRYRPLRRHCLSCRADRLPGTRWRRTQELYSTDRPDHQSDSRDRFRGRRPRHPDRNGRGTGRQPFELHIRRSRDVGQIPAGR